jgi:DNA-binding MarR family transcriptional regulator
MSTDSLGFLLADVSRLLRRTFQQRMEGSEITFVQARVLVNVARKEGIRQVELADLLELQPIALVHLIDQLEQMGMVERRPDPADRRAYQLFLLDAAAPHLAAIRQIGASIQADILRGLNKQQSVQFLSSLRVVRDNLAAR